MHQIVYNLPVEPSPSSSPSSLASFLSFSEAASQADRDVLASVQYYHDCKVAASIYRESDDEALDMSNSQDRLAADSVDSDSEDDEIQIELMEADLLAYEESQKNHREELHGLMAIAAARTKIFGDEHCNWTCRTSGVGVTHGADYIRLVASVGPNRQVCCPMSRRLFVFTY